MLQGKLTGRLLRTGDDGYDTRRLLFNRRFDDTRPAAIAVVAGPQDIRAVVSFAAEHRLPLHVRAGGHSYTGASSGEGLVVDLREMAAVSVDAGSATIASGAMLVDVYTALARRGVSVPAGSCPAVGLAGLALGGGMGVVGRQYGLTCDRLMAAQVVLADGRLVTASPASEPDLFWALRGGGGSFGVVTSLTLRTHPTRSLALFSYQWPWGMASRVVDGWQRWAPQQSDPLWSTCHVLATAKGPPTASIAGCYVGSSTDLERPLGGLTEAVGAAPLNRSVRDLDYLAAMLVEAGCAGQGPGACRIADYGSGGALPRDAFVASSDFFTSPIPMSGIEALAAAVERRQADRSLGVGGVGFDSWGGAIGRISATDTAFVHRNVGFGAQYTASWQDRPGNGPQTANQASLRTLQAALGPFATGAAYQNYADPSLADPQGAYYGANLARLRRVKRLYDPGDLFHLPQGIRP